MARKRHWLRAEAQVARDKDFHEIDNLESAYGYYLDKNLWNDLAELVREERLDGACAARRVQGRARARVSCVNVFGADRGPVAGRLGNHLQFQPVIHVATRRPDRQGPRAHDAADVQGPRASIGGSIYENEFVKEDGVWKISKLATWNTLSAGYEGGWAKNAGRGMPGPEHRLPAGCTAHA